MFACIRMDAFERRDMMKQTLEKLWNEYFATECATLDTDEERTLLKKASEMHRKASKALSETQSDTIEKYIELLYEIQYSFGKKAFCKGCEFAASFLLEARIF